ncbi:MAG TPA: LON peptidase substrate-binding domain-containing protein [Thermoanaerobaculia bacterium]
MPWQLPEGEFVLRLFPLPNVVFFPGTRLPLHVFEPRYRQLVSDAIASQEPIGMVLLREGWEERYYGNPPIHAVGTLGIIEQVVQLEDGRYNLLLSGRARYRIAAEETPVLYRAARVVAHPETAPSPMDAWAQREWLVELARRYLEILPGQVEVPELATASLESLVNALIMSLNLDMQVKQELLETDAIVARCEKAGAILEERLAAAQFLAPFRRDQDPEKN